jgi:hypothetical protein
VTGVLYQRFSSHIGFDAASNQPPQKNARDPAGFTAWYDVSNYTVLYTLWLRY